MTKGWASWAIAALAAAVVVAGVLVTGGPAEGRKYRRDTIRERDLGAISSLIFCQAHADGGRLPQELKVTPDCDMQLRLKDPFTDRAYAYQPTGPNLFKLCAAFETAAPERMAPVPLGQRMRDGCIPYEYLK